MLNALFNIIIAPVIQILEFFFTLFFEITNNHGLAVIGLSIVVTLCTLPLYMVAEQWQEKEREIQENLKPGTKRIKKFFKGDEQYMILTTFYKQNHYHPLMALRSSFSLLIQIPFFIAAYTFLSHLEALKGVSFLFIKDFGNPDATFKIGSFYINVLPIAMTLINCISGALYSKGHGINEKIQIFGCAAVFLLLLYNSPAGLVVYWTMNNIFSLVKNIFYKLKNPKKVLYTILCITAFLLFISTATILRKIKINKEFKKMQPPSIKTEIEPVYHLSKTGKNVIVIMQDRLFMPFVEQCFEEKPIFRQKFDGFTFYKNAISFGRYTMIGTPGIFGGYSFTPYEINQRSDETLQEKHNQAHLTLPIVFHEAGFSTTVSGLPYENYLEYPIENMYKGYEYVKRAETRGAYSDLWYQQHGVQKVQFLAKDIKRNFIWFSIFKMVSPVFRRTVYHNKYWTSFDSYNDGLPRFVDNYSELDYLPQLTDATSTENSFIMIDNETVHESILLDYPDYIPTGKEATRFGPGKYAKHDHFTTMMAVFNTYEKFFDYLKSIGVYDNTRIIIVSDHGTTVQVPELKNESGSKLKKQNVVATLLVKDFYAHGPVKEDMTFMTNADTPYLATKDIVAGAKNPFTGFPFLVEDKAPFVKIQIAQAQSTRIRKQTSFPVPKDEWFTVHDNIFVKENWAPLFSDGQ